MKALCLVALLLGAGVAAAQERTATADEMLRAAEQWAKENLDDDTLRSLKNVDRDRVKKFFETIQKDFQGEYVVDLAPLKDTARMMFTLLQSEEDTRPYAAWLKPRLDYLDTADEFRLLIPAPKTEPGKAAPPPPNPRPQLEREVWIKKMSDRPWPDEATPYVKRLKPVFAAEKVPTELVWVAEVESSFDPEARSPAGAVGLYQLTAPTAKRFGLSTWPFDQRLDPEDSARAAAKYLVVLHNKFKDWRLALAAYNSGEGTVQNLLKRHQAKTFDAIATHLPAETQLFVPKVEATLLRREGVKLAELPAPGR